jgi:hypothetical protein
MEHVNPFKLNIGDLSLPLDLHALTSGSEIAAAPAPREFSFRFTYRQIPVAARHLPGGEAGRLELSGDLGPFPYSAESSVARAELQIVLDAANGHLGRRFVVSRGRIQLVGAFPLPHPVTAVQLITGLAQFLTRVKPYLETIDVFLRPPAETARTGEGALRPGWRPVRPPRSRRHP